MEKMITAIVDNDTSAAKRLLQQDPGLASRLVQTAKLYDSGIFHWIYAGDSLLHLAAAGYRVDIIRLLLAAGADPNAAKNHRKSTPLHYASDGFLTGPAWSSDLQVATLECLLESGAEIHSQDMNGATPLHRAVRTRCAAAVRALLKAGADPTIRNKSGSTPFHLAVQNTGRGGSGEPIAVAGQREIIEQFLARKVSLNLRDKQGKSVIDAVQSGWIRELLVGNQE